MYLKLVCGGVGTGKSERCYGLIRAAKEKNPAWNMVMVVPDQFSFTAERAMAEQFSGTGPNGIEVLTFSRLIQRCLARRRERYMTSAGKRMLVYKAIHTAELLDSPFAGSLQKAGFLDEIADSLTEFSRYMVTPEMLAEQAKRCQNEMLSRKLYALSAIYKAFLDLTKDRFFDSEDDPKALAEWILNTDTFENTCFFLDEFSDFLPQHYLILQALIQKSRGVCVTLPIPQKPDTQLYRIPIATMERLGQIAEELGAKYVKEQLPDGCRFMQSAELRHMVENWGGWEDRCKYRGKTRDIHLFQAKDVYSEVENAAVTIRNLVRKTNCRYRDISLILGDMQAYTHIIEAVFRDAGIPYHTDLKQAVTDHPVITLAMSVFDIQSENWSYDSVFRYIKTGFIYQKTDKVRPLSGDDIDLLENYVLKRGIRGKKMWFSPWEPAAGGVFGAVLDEKVQDADDMERLNRIRSAIIEPFSRYFEKTAGRRSVREIAGAFFDFLTDIHLYEGLQAEIKTLQNAGFADEAGAFGLVWNALVEVVEQVVVTMGDEKCSKEDFGAFLRAGLSQCAISIIPSGMDSVFVGSADRSRQPHVRVVFVLGAVHGSMPKELAGEGILSDADRAELADYLPLGEDTKKRRAAEDYKLFRLLGAAAEKLYISYPAMDTEGTTQRPAQLVWSLLRIFPELDAVDGVLTDSENQLPASERRAFDLLIRQMANGEPDSGLYDWFSAQPTWQNKLQVLKQAATYQNIQPKIRAKDAKDLYGEVSTYSVSRLNEFGKCPFAYFLKYGLRAREQENWQIQKFELGSLMHWAVCEYSRIIEDGAEDFQSLKAKWSALTDERSRQIIDDVMQEAEGRIVGKLKRDREKVQYLIRRMTKTLKRSADIIRKSIAAGDYAAICYEKQFKIHIRWGEDSVRVMGTIDRVDLAEDADEKIADVRVVDYKSGYKDFDIVSIYNRQDMQLVVYAIAALEMYRTGELPYARTDYTPRAGGVLYDKLRDDVRTVAANADAAKRDAGKLIQADGVVVLDTENDKYTLDALYKTDRVFLEGGASQSEFIKIKLKKTDGLPDANSKVTSREDFDVLMNYVKKSVVEIDRQIADGRIDIAPIASGQQKGCTYCPYQDICLFDGVCTQGCKNAETAWEKMREEVEQ